MGLIPKNTVKKLAREKHKASYKSVLLLPIMQLILWVFVYTLCSCMLTVFANSCVLSVPFPVSATLKSFHALPPSASLILTALRGSSLVNVTRPSHRRRSRALKPTQVSPQGEVYPDPSINSQMFAVLTPSYYHLPYHDLSTATKLKGSGHPGDGKKNFVTVFFLLTSSSV